MSCAPKQLWHVRAFGSVSVMEPQQAIKTHLSFPVSSIQSNLVKTQLLLVATKIKVCHLWCL